MDHIFQCVVFFFLSYHIQASRAVTPVFVKKGSDVQLDVKEDDIPKDKDFFAWKFNGEINLVRYSPDGTPSLYSERVEFSVTNYSLTLKHLKETDSGDYTAIVLGAKDKNIAEYKVTVQAPVSPVNLTANPVSSSSFCNLTVTCRTQDSNISTTFTCVNQTCSKDGDRAKATTSGADLRVYFENDSIKCNHSNQVNWTTNQEASEIQMLCNRKPSLNSTAGIVVGSVAGVLFIASGVVFICKKNKDKKKSNGNTLYDNPQDINSAQTQTQEPVTSTYALVQFPQRSEHPTDTVNTSSPETIYAQVMKREKPNSPSLESPTLDLYST